MPVSDSNDSVYSVVSVQNHDIIQRVQAAAGQAVSSGNVEVLEYLLAADGLDVNNPQDCRVYRSHVQPKSLLALSKKYVDLDGQATLLYLQDDFQHLYVDMQTHALDQIAAMEIILQCLADKERSADFVGDDRKFKEHEAYVIEELLKDTQVWLEQRKAKFYAVFMKDIQSFGTVCI